MKKNISVALSLVLIGVLLVGSEAFAEGHIYAALLGGTVAMTETQGAETYNHVNQFFVGHLGGALGGGVVLAAKNLGIGLVGEMSWLGNNIDRRHKANTDSKTYRDESQRVLAGAMFSLRPGPMEINLEYYPVVVNRVSYSDQKSENPFRKSDSLKATGYGLGFAFKLFPPMRNFLLFRRLSYQDVDMAGVGVKLPTDQYSALAVDEVVIGFGSEF